MTNPGQSPDPPIDSRTDEQKRSEALDTAWRIHGAQADWSGKVDSKASFALTIESALLLGIISFAKDGGPLAHLTGTLQVWLFRASFIVVVSAILCAANVVMPRLRMSHVSGEWQSNFIYFGHLQYWKDHNELARKIRDVDILPVLAAQLNRMGKIAWTKHLFLKASLFLAAISGILAILAGIIK